jgi:DNA-binding MarR family transcriptional regulator
MNEHHELQVRGLFIPLDLFKDKRLTTTEKLLIVLVDMLDNGSRHCYASNHYLGELLGVTEQHVINSLTKLRRLGWVSDLPGGEDKRRITTLLGDTRGQLRRVAEREDVPTDKSVGQSLEQSAVQPLEPVMAPPINRFLDYKDECLEIKEESALSIFKTFFPDVSPNLFQQDQLTTYVTDLSKWKTTVVFWKTNGYQGRHVGRLIDCYTNGNALPKANGNGNGRQQVTGMVVQDDLAQYPNRCPICGNTGQETCPYHKQQ